MNYDYEQTTFSKSVLAGLFAGIMATCANLVYNFIYRNVTDFQLSEIINVSSIIIASLILLTIAGLIFYCFQHYLKKGGIIFRIFFLLLTVVSIYFSMHVQRSSNPILSSDFKGLIIGMIIIMSAFSIFYIPYLFNHETDYI